jgi:hypothetical protein
VSSPGGGGVQKIVLDEFYGGPCVRPRSCQHFAVRCCAGGVKTAPLPWSAALVTSNRVKTLFTRKAAACSDRGTEEGQSCAGLRGRWIYRSPPRKAVIVQLGLGLYVSPVRFNCNIVPEQWGLAYSLTRMVGVIDGFRWCVREGNSALGEGFLPSLAVAGLFVWFGIRQLRKMARSFADSI